MPKISIITVCYNAADTISDCIESVLQQNVEAEHIIIDGGSTDETIQITNKYRNKLARFISETDEGIYDAMNKGIKLATGDIIGILNADDYYANQHILEKVIDTLDAQNIEACYGDLIYVDKNNINKTVRYWRSEQHSKNSFFWGWMPPHPTFFVKRTIYERHGNFNLAMGTAADYEIMLRFLLKNNIRATYIPEVLVKMRTGGISNASLKKRIAANIMDRKAWSINQLTPYPWTLILKPIRKIDQWLAK